MKLPPVILASASPRRAELLRKTVRQFEVIPARAEEFQPEHLSPSEACMLNAYRKARAVAKRFPDALVIGADTEVCLGRRVFGKPATRAEAEQMLLDLEGKEHRVITGVCLLHLRRHRQRTLAVTTRVTFKPLGADEVAEYLDKIDPLDKAGAYAIQEHGELIIAKTEGSFSNVVGLPVERLKTELRQFVSD
ncbi:MAG TPA: Maf family protein [Methylomirabilota bacterium]|nr:Maf family protein [Methylomirabilota bacterium]